ncbi:ferredoxin [Isoptericola croceus]|uniref:ferredoxin n=1 Tax=Isoptericola croceus TaxID=3031406 RepID=UPI0023F7C572|nr:ferredoxin [Isoptericola croceus]
MGARVAVDRTRCIGSGNCVLVAAALFDQDDTLGMVSLLPAAHRELTRQDAAAAAEAVGRCPAGALRLVTTPASSAQAT